jgi:DNA-binding response OmpR family regulator
LAAENGFMETTPASSATVLFGFGYPETRATYFSMFRQGNFNLLTACTGDEVLRLFEGHPEVSLVVLTAEMGSLNGFEILQQMKRSRSGITVFLLSAQISMETLKLASICGCNEILQLPLHRQEIITLIKKYLYQT